MVDDSTDEGLASAPLPPMLGLIASERPSLDRERSDASAPGRRAEPAQPQSKLRPPAPRREKPESAPIRIIRQIPDWIRDAVLLGALVGLGLAFLALRENRRFRRARREVLFDPLTGVASRLGLERRLALDWPRAVRYDRPLGVLVLDVNDFKQINDTHGHAAGDKLLRRVAATIATRIRASDLVARTGGDEFVVVTVETHGCGLATLAASLGKALEALPAGVSIGWSERTPADQSASQVLHRADLAMYEAKQHLCNVAEAEAAPLPEAGVVA